MDIIKYFKYNHLPEGPMLQCSRMISRVADSILKEVPDGPEKEAGMRKLLEAKDCFVRACLPE